jgi:ubiquinone/menaquinone biosynthesis C-methylase UbiE
MDDLARLRTEYADRARRFADSDVYSAFNRANLFAIQSRQRAVLDALRQHGLTDLSGLRIFEMGCGGGGVLVEYLGLGASPRNLYGIDLLSDRLPQALFRLPASNLANADGANLPFPANAFDLVLQYTAISSILDPNLRRAICADMLRVTRPGGLILSYDFWLNPTNKQTLGLRPAEIRESFPGCAVRFYKITLAPPIARRLVPLSWTLALLLESLGIFNTHYLAAIRKP